MGNRLSRAILDQAASTAVEGTGEAISDAVTNAPPEPPGDIPAVVPIVVGVTVSAITEGNLLVGALAAAAVKLSTETTPTGEGRTRAEPASGLIADPMVRPDATAQPPRPLVNPCAELVTPVLRCPK